jgi:hypothetical protein
MLFDMLRRLSISEGTSNDARWRQSFRVDVGLISVQKDASIDEHRREARAGGARKSLPLQSGRRPAEQ